MRYERKASLIQNGIIAVLLVLSAVLLLTGLGNNYFWDDEADTGIFARSILSKGIPSGWDGTNLYGYRNGILLNANLVNRVSPWLQYYVTALSFSVLGQSTFAARFPFALLGILSVPVFFAWAKRHTGCGTTAVLACLYLVLSPVFLLFARQCRYYSLVIFFAVMLLYVCERISGRDKNWLLWCIIISIFFFYGNYFAFFSFLGALVVAHLVSGIDSGRIRILVVSGLAALLVGLFYLSYAKPYQVQVSTIPFFSVLRLKNTGYFFCRYIWDYSLCAFLPGVYVFLLPLALLKKADEEGYKGLYGWRADRKGLFIAVLILGMTFFLALLSPQDHRKTLIADVRYAVCLLPVMCLLMALITAKIVRWKLSVGVLLIAGTIFTNIFTFMPLYTYGAVKSYLSSYVYEITHDYQTPYEAVVEFLEENAEEGDVILVRPEYAAYPLLFYTGKTFRFCGILTEDNENILPYWKDKLPAYVYEEEIFPDWMIFFGLGSQLLTGAVDYVREQGIQYETHIIDMFWKDVTRPEIPLHNFEPVADYFPEEVIFIVEKKE